MALELKPFTCLKFLTESLKIACKETQESESFRGVSARWRIFGESSKDFGMRHVIVFRRPMGSVPIKETELDLDAGSLDDAPALPIGLRATNTNEAMRTELFRLLDKHILPRRTGATSGGSPSSPSTSSGPEGVQAGAAATKMRRLSGAPPESNGRKEAGGRACARAQEN